MAAAGPTCKVVRLCPAWWAVSDGRDVLGEVALRRCREQQKLPEFLPALWEQCHHLHSGVPRSSCHRRRTS